MKNNLNVPRDPVVEELHRMREADYEKTKHLSPAERARMINREADKLAKKYGLRLRYADKVKR